MVTKKRPKFSRDFHRTFDERGRTAVKAALAKIGYFAIDNPDRYGVDLIIKDNSGKTIGFADAEVRQPWTTFDKDFPFETIHAVNKKIEVYSKFPLPVWYCVSAKDGSGIMVLTVKEIKKQGKKTTVKNFRQKTPEIFYEVHRDLWRRLPA